LGGTSCGAAQNENERKEKLTASDEAEFSGLHPRRVPLFWTVLKSTSQPLIGDQLLRASSAFLISYFFNSSSVLYGRNTRPHGTAASVGNHASLR
jgi:hypothetical protein